MPYSEELQMLKVVVVVLEWSEGKCEACGCVGLEYCCLWEDLKDSHVFSIEVLSSLCDP